MNDAHRPVLVVGATGFVGRKVVAALRAEDLPVRCLVRSPQRAADFGPDSGIEVMAGDMLDLKSVTRAAAGTRAVVVSVHTLSKQQQRTPGHDFIDVEEVGLTNIIDACRTGGVRRALYVTSIGVAADAPSSWTRGRYRTEQLLLTSGLDATVLRPGMIVGPGGDGFSMVERGGRSRFAILLAGRAQRFRPVAVDDLAAAVVELLDEPASFGHHFDVGSDDVLTMDQMVDKVAEHLGRSRPIKVHLPRRLIAQLAPLIERVTGVPPGAVAGLVGDGADADLVGKPEAIRPLLSSAPRSFDQALIDALA